MCPHQSVSKIARDQIRRDRFIAAGFLRSVKTNTFLVALVASKQFETVVASRNKKYTVLYQSTFLNDQKRYKNILQMSRNK